VLQSWAVEVTQGRRQSGTMQSPMPIVRHSRLATAMNSSSDWPSVAIQRRVQVEQILLLNVVSLVHPRTAHALHPSRG
jgi:hypothetical protein